MTEDISRGTVVVLVVLTLAVSIIGTWAVMDEMARVPVAQPEPAQGQVRLEITSSGIVPSSDATAKVQLQILDAN